MNSRKYSITFKNKNKKNRKKIKNKRNKRKRNTNNIEIDHRKILKSKDKMTDQIVMTKKVKKTNIRRNKSKNLNIKNTEIVQDLNKNVKEDTPHLLQVDQIDYFNFLNPQLNLMKKNII
jgi:hypothetical protein